VRNEDVFILKGDESTPHDGRICKCTVHKNIGLLQFFDFSPKEKCVGYVRTE